MEKKKNIHTETNKKIQKIPHAASTKKGPRWFLAEYSSITNPGFDWVIDYFGDKRRRLLTVTLHEVEVRRC